VARGREFPRHVAGPYDHSGYSVAIGSIVTVTLNLPEHLSRRITAMYSFWNGLGAGAASRVSSLEDRARRRARRAAASQAGSGPQQTQRSHIDRLCYKHNI
jgi:hypothetical protein